MYLGTVNFNKKIYLISHASAEKLTTRRISLGTNSPPTELSFANVNIINNKKLF